MSKGGECRCLQIAKSTVVITILWTPGACSNWPPSSQFQSTETQGFRGKAEAQNSRSKLIAILNDTFPNFLLTLALPGLCWAALPELYVSVTKDAECHLYQITLSWTDHPYHDCTYTPFSVVYQKHLSYETILHQGFSVFFSLPVCLQLAQQLCFSLLTYMAYHIRSYSWSSRWSWFCHITGIL